MLGSSSSSTQEEIDRVIKEINKTCTEKGGKYAGYSCKEVVSWDDASRGVVDWGLSCWGHNITDSRLYKKGGESLFTIRSDNWNEKLGKLGADRLAVRVGNNLPGLERGELRAVSLKQFLSNIGEYGRYAGLSFRSTLLNQALDDEVSIRFQTTFLPVDDAEKATIEFVGEAFNYNTHNDNDPRNLLLLCTTQGTAVQQGGSGRKKLFHHRVDEDGKVHRHWLEAEETQHKVGAQQIETADEREDAKARGKATSEIIGTESMGSRFNVVMTIQIPLQQASPDPPSSQVLDVAVPLSTQKVKTGKKDKKRKSRSRSKKKGKGGKGKGGKGKGGKARGSPGSVRESHKPKGKKRRSRSEPPTVGKASAARVSRGTEEDVWPGLTVTSPKRSGTEHVTVTVIIYNVVAGGVPSEDDVINAIDDMEQLYASCEWTGRLAEDGASFMRHEMTTKEADKVAVAGAIEYGR